MFRLGSININNLSPHRYSYYDERVCRRVLQTELDIVLLQETGVNWSVLPKSRQWKERTKEYFEPGQLKARFGCNTNDETHEAKQWGGTGVLSHGKLSFYSLGTGVDNTQLGRWTWARYRGKGGTVLRVVSIYQPCTNKTGAQSVYAQQKNYFQSKNDDRDP